MQTCPKCNFKTKCHESLVSHVTKKHKLCLKCNKSFILQSDLLTHLELQHGEEVNCNFCDFQAYPSFELFYHKLSEHGICGKCEKPKEEIHFNIGHESRILELNNLHSPERAEKFSIETFGSSSEDEKDDKIQINPIKKEPLEPIRHKPQEKTETFGDLDCKFCNKYFTYTAPDRKTLIFHLKTNHPVEFAKDCQKLDMKIPKNFAKKAVKSGPKPGPKSAVKSADPFEAYKKKIKKDLKEIEAKKAKIQQNLTNPDSIQTKPSSKMQRIQNIFGDSDDLSPKVQKIQGENGQNQEYYKTSTGKVVIVENSTSGTENWTATKPEMSKMSKIQEIFKEDNQEFVLQSVENQPGTSKIQEIDQIESEMEKIHQPTDENLSEWSTNIFESLQSQINDNEQIQKIMDVGKNQSEVENLASLNPVFDENDDDPLSAIMEDEPMEMEENGETDLSCKLCNTYFTYTAPDKKSLIEHYKTVHQNDK